MRPTKHQPSELWPRFLLPERKSTSRLYSFLPLSQTTGVGQRRSGTSAVALFLTAVSYSFLHCRLSSRTRSRKYATLRQPENKRLRLARC